MRRSRTQRGHGPRKRLLLSGVLLAVLAALALAASQYVGRGALLEGTLEIFGSPEALKGYLLGFGAWAPVVFFLAQVAQAIWAPLPGGATALVGILLFGPWVGTALNLAGGLVGSVVLFALGDDEKGALLLVVMLVPFVLDDVAVAIAGFRWCPSGLRLGGHPGAVARLVGDGLGRGEPSGAVGQHAGDGRAGRRGQRRC